MPEIYIEHMKGLLIVNMWVYHSTANNKILTTTYGFIWLKLLPKLIHATIANSPVSLVSADHARKLLYATQGILM